MTDTTGPAEQQQRAAAWLNEAWTQPKACPVCGDERWVYIDISELTLVTVPRKPGDPGAFQVPVYHLMCDTCGYMMTFNAIRGRALGDPPPNPGDGTPGRWRL